VRSLFGSECRELRFILFTVIMALSLVASERARWPGTESLLDARMLFGLVVPLLAGLLLTERRGHLGLGIGHPTRGVAVLALGMPVALAAGALLACSGEVRGFYRGCPTEVLALANAYALAILQVEVCFRGVLLFGLLDLTPRTASAVALSTLPYALTHLDKPMPEALGSVPVGLALGAATAWTRSVWYGWAVHLTGAVALALFTAAS
jgi:hypothetical protein